MDTTSATLLDELRRPNQQSWSKFVALYTPLIFYWARRTGLQAADAADLVQRVFAVLVVKLPDFQYDKSKSFRAWLRTVTLNRWRERRRRKALDVCPNDMAPQSQGVECELEEVWEMEYQRHLLSTAIQALVPANRQWTAIGVTLRQDMEVRITASGEVDAAPETDTREYYQEVPPAGRQERIPHFPEPTLPGLCLLGRIGKGPMFYVGGELSFLVKPSDAGELYLGINDDLVDDNFGAWKVQIQTRTLAPK